MVENKKHMPLVSVMIPVYNGAEEILTSLSSLLLQTYTNWECIIVDDGSTDATLQKIDLVKDDRIKVFSFAENNGRPFARQKALEEATGGYLAMLDADDWYYANKLEKQVKYLEEHPTCVLVSTAMAITDAENQLDVVQTQGNEAISSYTYSTPQNYVFVPHAASLIRMEEAKKIAYDPQLAVGQDQDFMFRLLKGNDYAFLNEVLYVYNLGGSLSLKKYAKGQMATITIWKKHLPKGSVDLLKKQVAARAKIALAYVLKTIGMLSFLSSRRGQIPSDNERNAFTKQQQLIIDQTLHIESSTPHKN